MSLILENCKNPRDRTLFSLLYDSGYRIGELMTLKNKDLDFDQYGAVSSVAGKTGYRKVRVVGNSISYLREWQNPILTGMRRISGSSVTFQTAQEMRP